MGHSSYDPVEQGPAWNAGKKLGAFDRGDFENQDEKRVCRNGSRKAAGNRK